MRHIAGRRALIWPIHHIASVPAIMGIQGTMASVPWIFVQTMVSPGHPDLPLPARGSVAVASRGVMYVIFTVVWPAGYLVIMP